MMLDKARRAVDRVCDEKGHCWAADLQEELAISFAEAARLIERLAESGEYDVEVALMRPHDRRVRALLDAVPA